MARVNIADKASSGSDDEGFASARGLELSLEEFAMFASAVSGRPGEGWKRVGLCVCAWLRVCRT